MIKLAIGLIIGLTISAALSDPITIGTTTGNPAVPVLVGQNKVFAHLDDEELEAIRKACH